MPAKTQVSILREEDRLKKIAIREALIAAGFKRVEYTRDHGDGHYDERWANGTDDVLVRWKHEKMKRIEENEHYAAHA